MSAKDVITLPSLLPSSYLVAYAIPLLVASILSTFMGSFLTLDRTRSFAPHQALEAEKGLSWRYEGGVGGTVGGFLCGVHVSTFLALLISNRTSSSLGPVQFLVIWMLSAIAIGALASRWRIAALCAYGVIGGGSIAALISIVFLPSLTARLVILGVFTVLLVVGVLLPYPVIRHSALRTSAAFSGALGIVESIALFKRVASWSNPWLTLVVKPISGTRNGAEKGLSAAVCIFAVVGILNNWILKRYVGENPDKEWDAYLSRYAKGLPFDSERQGLYRPLPSFWSKLFGKGSKTSQKDDMIFPPDSTLSSEKNLPLSSPAPGFKPYSTRKNSTRSMLVKSGQVPDLSDSDSDSETDGATGPPKFRPWLAKRTSTSNSAATTVSPHGSNEKRKFSVTLDAKPVFIGSADPTIYSDEEDVTAVHSSSENSSDKRTPGWKPKFLRDHEEEKERLSIRSKDLDVVRSESPDQLTSSSTSLPPQTMPSPTSPHPVSVPATPSLIRAVDRITQAQRDAYGLRRPPRMPTRGESLDATFWNEVHAKALEEESEKQGKSPKA